MRSIPPRSARFLTILGFAAIGSFGLIFVTERSPRGVGVTHAAEDTEDGADLETANAEVARIAAIREGSPQETYRRHNELLNAAFDRFLASTDGRITAESIGRFNAIVRRHGMTSFDDFRSVMLSPIRQVTDPATGESIPIFGPLGSDMINPWLAAMGVAEGKPLGEQPMYRLAGDVLREHFDFAIIGKADPGLTMDIVPEGLRESVAWAYARLNPTNQFDGGFDQPLFYATIREAVTKVFRKDHPRAKLNMADVILPEEHGGLGIRSCLLCHERNHTDVYARLLGQSYFHRGKAEDMKALLESGSNAALSEEARHSEKLADTFQLAAERMIQYHGDKIDVEGARKGLEVASATSLNRLLPGFDEFYRALDDIGCTMCHSTDSEPETEHKKAKFNAFVLTPNDYYKSNNVRALAELIDMQDIGRSKLLAKASGKEKHRGADELRLDDNQMIELKAAIDRWVHSVGPR